VRARLVIATLLSRHLNHFRAFSRKFMLPIRTFSRKFVIFHNLIFIFSIPMILFLLLSNFRLISSRILPTYNLGMIIIGCVCSCFIIISKLSFSNVRDRSQTPARTAHYPATPYGLFSMDITNFR